MKFTEEDIKRATELYDISAEKRTRIARERGMNDLATPYVPKTRKHILTMLKRTSDLNPELTKEEVIRRAAVQSIWGGFTENVSRKWSDELSKRGKYVSYQDIMLGAPAAMAALGFDEDLQIQDDASVAAEVLRERYWTLRQQGLSAEETNRRISTEFFGSP